MLPMGFGYAEGVTHDYVRHGTTTLFAALNVLNGAILASCKPRHRHQEFLSFLREIDKAVPQELDVHCIVDNYASHKHPKVRAWLAQRPRWHMHFIPTYSSWLNQVERFFAIITRTRRSAARLIQKRQGVDKEDRQLRHLIQREMQAVHLDRHSGFDHRKTRPPLRTNYRDRTLAAVVPPRVPSENSGQRSASKRKHVDSAARLDLRLSLEFATIAFRNHLTNGSSGGYGLA
jgi:transposase